MTQIVNEGLSLTKVNTADLLDDKKITVGWELEFAVPDAPEKDDDEYNEDGYIDDSEDNYFGDDDDEWNNNTSLEDIESLLSDELQIYPRVEASPDGYKNQESEGRVTDFDIDSVDFDNLEEFFIVVKDMSYKDLIIQVNGKEYKPNVFESRAYRLFHAIFASQRDLFGDDYKGSAYDFEAMFDFMKKKIGALHTIILMKLWPKYGFYNEKHAEYEEDHPGHLAAKNAKFAKSLEGLNIRSDADVEALISSIEDPEAIAIPEPDEDLYSNYTLTVDGSIRNGRGFELVSPKQELRTALADISRLFEWVDSHHFETNASTGFHVSMSYGDSRTTRKIDYLKLAVLLGEEHILGQFDRLNNTFTVAQMKIIRDQVKESMKSDVNTDGLNRVLDRLRNMFKADKYTGINISKLKRDGYIEFRIMGGEGYHKRFPEIKKVILRYALVMKIALDPKAYRQEYLKKIYQILDKQHGTPEQKAASSFMTKDLLAQAIHGNAREQTPALQYYKLFSEHMAANKRSGDQADRNLAARALLDMIRVGAPLAA